MACGVCVFVEGALCFGGLKGSQKNAVLGPGWVQIRGKTTEIKSHEDEAPLKKAYV